MKNLIWIICTLALVMCVSGCIDTGKSVEEINQDIQERYNSCSAVKYTVTESLYENDVLTQTQKYTEMVKKPDKHKKISEYETDQRSGSKFSICNCNTLYSSVSPRSIHVYEYVNLLPEMSTYCGYFVDKVWERFKIPMEITDKTKYRVETSEVVYDGKDAIMAIVTELMSEEAKQKQIDIGNEPRESVTTYWFDLESLAILKEESHGFATMGEVVQTIGGKIKSFNNREIERKTVKIYEDFSFDIDLPDSEFEIDASDYPGVEFEKEIVDTQEKFK